MAATVGMMSCPKPCNKSKYVQDGIEFPNKMMYLNWEPGGEYTQVMIMKNVNLSTQKIKFKLSNNQFSSPVCHQPLILCAGTSYKLPVTFRPCGKNPFETFIEFETAGGKIIKIPIKAVLSHPKLAVTEHLKFGMCAVKSSTSIDFEMSNIGNVSAFYSWKNPQVFSVNPKFGHLAPKETCRLNATFNPQAAKVYDNYATCTFSNKDVLNCVEDTNSYVHKKIMKLEGIGKYPYVIAKICSESTKVAKTSKENVVSLESVVNFGCVAIGHSSEKWISVENPSPVSCVFLVYHANSSASFKSPFICTDNEKSLQPQASSKVKIVYAPKLICECSDICYFNIQAQGGCGSTKIKCVGKCVGPAVCIENDTINFGNIEIGKVSTSLIHLKNKAEVSTFFQLQIDKSSVFCCDIISGVLEPFSNITISVKFVPQAAIPYFRTVSLIVHNQEPLFIHFIGTGFSEIQTPVHFQPSDIKKYIIHAQEGISLLPPERLKELIEKGMLFFEHTLKSSSRSIISLPPPQKTCYQSGYDKYLNSEQETSSVVHITSDTDTIEFGYCSPSFSSDGRTITLYNHTYGEVSCVWMAANLKYFEIIPPDRYILPRRSASFTVFFKPDKPSQFYNIEMECFLCYKELNDYSRVNPLTVTPPWCLTARLSGHSFSKDFGSTFPESSFYSEDVLFPPTIVGQSVYQTIVIKNAGNEPNVFSVKEDIDKIFTLKPTSGVIPNNEFQLVVIKMIPREAKVYEHLVKFQLNSTGAVNSKSFSLHGSGEIPKTILENKGLLCFKPTCIGTTSSQAYTVRNSSGIPLRFEWKHPSLSKSKIFCVKPSNGIILPNEIQEHKWYFTPTEAKQYELKSALHSSLSADNNSSVISRIKSKAVLEILGVGLSGIIKCFPTTYNFGVMIVGTTKYCYLSLSNPGLCDLNFSLSVKYHDVASTSDVTELNPMRGVIYARSTVQIKVSVRPCHSVTHYCTVMYTLTSPHQVTLLTTAFLGHSDDSQNGTTFINTDLCQISFIGVYPSMNIVDIQGSGSASQISKANLWKMLSINMINDNLNDVPLTSELRYSIGSRHSLRHTIPMKARTVINCDFGAAPFNSENFNIHFVLKNDGPVTTQWAFLMSSDVWLEPEIWADCGQLDEIEKNESYMLKNDIFTIAPRRGCLESGSDVSIMFTYKHSHVGINKLPVLLKINSGRELVLNLAGVTVDKGCPYLHIGCKQHVFDPVPIGIHSYPRQVFPLYNGGDTTIGYEIDTDVLTNLTQANYLLPIFECLQPSGHILPGTTLPLEFIFRPIEARRYSVDIPIHLSTGDTTVVTLVGIGCEHDSKNEQKQLGQLISGISKSPKDVASFSHESVDFGCVPQFATVSKIVFLKNNSQHTLSFIWEKDLQKVITVEPMEGYIQPGKSTACKVIFCSHSLSCIYNFDQICHIIDESDNSSHEAAMRKWNEKNEDEKYALLITQDIDSSQQSMKFSSDLRGKLGTLPPIGEPQQSYEEWKRSDLSTKSKKRPTSKKAVDKGPPVRTLTNLLQLHITASSLSVCDYVKLYSDFDDYYIDYHTLGLQSSALCCVRQNEVDFQKFVLNQVIMEILKDSNFHQALKRITKEPVPYFARFSTRTRERYDLISKPKDLISKPNTLTSSGNNILYHDSLQQEESSSKNISSLKKMEICEDVSDISKITPGINDDELCSIVDSTVQNTLLNVITEANLGEFIVDNPLCSITTSQT